MEALFTFGVAAVFLGGAGIAIAGAILRNTHRKPWQAAVEPFKQPVKRDR